MRTILLGVLFALASANANVAAADCAMVQFSAIVLTPQGANVGPHGGVVIAQIAFGGASPATPMTTWRFRNGAHLDAPAITHLAPGLDVLAPRLRGAKVVLEGGDHATVIGLAAAGSSAAELAAPAIKSVGFRESRGRHSSASGWAELAGDPPDGVVALVVFDKAGKPRSFGGVTRNAKQVTIYSASDCGGPFDGTVASPPGDEIRLAWVDAGGALSKQTAPIRVGH